jgi:photosystem II stability/assembly factor-like uncharacterized protein
MAIGLTHSGPNIYSSTEAPREVFVGTQDGVTVLERDNVGAPWRVARRELPGRYVSSVVVEPESRTIFVGAFKGGIHASTDGGHTWEHRENGLTIDDVFSMAARRVGGKVRVFAGTEPANLFYSDDLGRNWTHLPNLRNVPTVDTWSFPPPPHIAHTKFITFDPTNEAVIFACIEQGALLKSEDHGETWRELNTLGYYSDKTRKMENFYDVHKAVVDPRDPQKLFVTGGAGLYVTPDQGGHWERRMAADWADDVYPDPLVLHPRQPDLMFMAAASHNPQTWRKTRHAGGRVYRSTDAGVNWERLTDGLPEDTKDEFGAMSLVDWGSGLSLFAATTGGQVYASDDGGDHWTLIANDLPAITKRGHAELVLTGTA